MHSDRGRPKVYIAAPFRRDSDRASADPGSAYGELTSPDKIAGLEAIESVLLRAGYDTCLPHRDEGDWGKTYYEPAPIAALCLRHVESSDLVVAVPGRSRGVHIELGYAAARGTPVVAFVDKHDEASTLLPGLGQLVKGIPESGELRVVPFDAVAEIPGLLADVFGLTDSAPEASTKTAAVVDIGSNSIKLGVYSLTPGRVPIRLHGRRESITISEEIRESGRIGGPKLADLEAVLRDFADVLREFLVQKTSVIGTAALRQAENSSGIAALVLDVFGVELRTVNQKTEAELVRVAVASSLNSQHRDIAVLNLGAGSIQLIPNANDRMIRPALYDFGTVRLAHDFPWDGGWSSKLWREFLAHVGEALESEPLARTRTANAMVHTGGELDFLLRCGVTLDYWGGSHTHVSAIPLERFAAFAEQFAGADRSVLAETTGLQSAWLAGSVASNAIAVCAARLFGADLLVPSNLNITDGVLAEAVEQRALVD